MTTTTTPTNLVHPAGDGPVLGSLCTGYGGLDLGVTATLGGGRLAWVADPDRHVRALLDARLPGVPNLGDITALDWDQIPPVDVLTAGFPCQDISSAGKGAGIVKGNRSGLWHDVIAAVRHLQPSLVIVENVAALRWRDRGLGIVLGDLAQVRYDARWASVRASDVGAPHQRERVFIVAWPRHRDNEPAAAAAAHPQGLRLHPLGFQPAVPEGGRASRRAVRRGDRTVSAPAGPWGVAADAGGGEPQRRGGPGDLAGSPRPAPGQGERLRTIPGDRHLPPASQPTPARELIDWGPYEPAIRGWEARLGRPAPHPTEPHPAGKHPRLAPVFVEWLMGLDPGWVTDLPGLSRATQLRVLGNGVVPQQAAHAVRLLLADTAEPQASTVKEAA